MSEEIDIPDDVIATLSDYLDNTLPAEARAEVAKKVADDALWKRAHTELVEQREFLSGMQKARAPVTFDKDVTSKLNKRSAGRLFARRSVGDGIPFMALMAVALIGLIVIAWVMWSSSTGSLKKDQPAPGSGAGSQSIVPRP